MNPPICSKSTIYLMSCASAARWSGLTPCTDSHAALKFINSFVFFEIIIIIRTQIDASKNNIIIHIIITVNNLTQHSYRIPRSLPPHNPMVVAVLGGLCRIAEHIKITTANGQHLLEYKKSGRIKYRNSKWYHIMW